MRPAIKIGLIAGVLVLCGGYAVAWKVAAHAVSGALDDWFAAEREAGRNWSCRARDIGGFPIRIELRCVEPAFAGDVNGARVEGSVGDIRAFARVYQPERIEAEIASPLRVRSAPDRGSIDVAWSSLRVAYETRNGEFIGGAAAWERPQAKAADPALGEVAATAASVALDVHQNAADTDAFDATFRGAGIVAPLVDAIAGDSSPLDATATATASKIGAATELDGPLPEAWRRVGGALTITRAEARKGDLDMAATGTLALDDSHRLVGSLNVASAGVKPLLDRLGLPSAVLAIGSLLGGGGNLSPLLEKPVETRFALTLQNGRVSLGPLRLPIVLIPLY